VGEGPNRNWDDCRKYGFLSAGRGTRYSDPLKKLKVGDKVFAYMKSLGYVGFGEIAREAVMVKDFTVDEKRTLLEVPVTQVGIRQYSDDPIMSDWVVGVKWLKSFGRNRLPAMLPS
jgi:hypothetical protein